MRIVSRIAALADLRPPGLIDQPLQDGRFRFCGPADAEEAQDQGEPLIRLGRIAQLVRRK